MSRSPSRPPGLAARTSSGSRCGDGSTRDVQSCQGSMTSMPQPSKSVTLRVRGPSRWRRSARRSARSGGQRAADRGRWPRRPVRRRCRRPAPGPRSPLQTSLWPPLRRPHVACLAAGGGCRGGSGLRDARREHPGRRLLAEPVEDARVRLGAHQLGEHVGVEDDHRRGSGGSRIGCRGGSRNSTPPSGSNLRRIAWARLGPPTS